MQVGSRSELRRINHAQNLHNKKSLILSFFILLTLIFSLVTFMNPSFMKKQLAKENNSVVVERYINDKFDNFANSINANRNGDTSNILTTKQTKPIADAMIDYTLGFHLFRTETASVAEEIKTVIFTKINDNSSTEAQSVKKILKKNNTQGIYAIITGFNLSNLTLAANIETLFVLVNVLISVLCIISLIAILKDMMLHLSGKGFFHTLSSAGMWTGALSIIIYGILALTPMLFSVESLPLAIGYWLEIASGIFLELVIIGVGLFIISTICWQLTSSN
ncbi:hypothetical protein FP435_07340 [Lactobacillus sp. PV037]|uniref:hypothetical protein n=1 Tax=unclassified Lactobacillus TaxID=2620435 RepID=UPI00223EE8BD|nr:MULTISPECIES: hypothetical protein [unclassified Lactobacillus]QNQ81711.1 hypothetical protein FP433_00910 [Lactobacillus sp. PV012]QNQ84244.1 hypothetical protein FP435_07340 [Lactobacillus sp. PV037]